jgi:hypothetical protein
MKKRLKTDKGFAYIDAVVLIIITMLVLSLVIGILPVFIQWQNLDYMTHEVVKEAEIVGNIGPKVLERYEEVRSDTGLDPKSISFDGTETIGGTQNIQMNDTIRVTLTSDYKWFSGFLGKGITTEITTTATGRSGVYHK